MNPYESPRTKDEPAKWQPPVGAEITFELAVSSLLGAIAFFIVDVSLTGMSGEFVDFLSWFAEFGAKCFCAATVAFWVLFSAIIYFSSPPRR